MISSGGNVNDSLEFGDQHGCFLLLDPRSKSKNSSVIPKSPPSVYLAFLGQAARYGIATRDMNDKLTV